MSVGTIRLNPRSKQLYAKRPKQQPPLRDLRLAYGCEVRAFVRARRRVAARAQQGTATV